MPASLAVLLARALPTNDYEFSALRGVRNINDCSAVSRLLPCSSHSRGHARTARSLKYVRWWEIRPLGIERECSSDYYS
ncbi:hypothetical protein K474DRAFT_1670702 [Panus rudis PR-1116 ss-1]|nr:hypothetical protein K474DRAFT_1670702 [Panus rudis PR-1116 ss-1]